MSCTCQVLSKGEWDEKDVLVCPECEELNSKEALESGEPNVQTFTAEMLCAECGERLGSNAENCGLCNDEDSVSRGDLRCDEEKGA